MTMNWKNPILSGLRNKFIAAVIVLSLVALPSGELKLCLKRRMSEISCNVKEFVE